MFSDEDGRIRLPESARGSREWWLHRRGQTIVLLPRTPDLRKLYIEPTTDCALDCVTCLRRVWDEPIGIMALSLFRDIIEQSRAFPELRSLLFGGIGEPTGHPEIFEMIRLARGRGLTVTLSTNGLNLDRNHSRRLVQLGVDRVVVSIDGVEPEVYRDVRGVSLSRVLDNIKELNRAKSELGSLYPRVELEFVALRRNVADLPRLAELAGELNANRVLVSHVLPYTEQMRAETLYAREPVPPLKAGTWAVNADAWVLWGGTDLPRMHWGAERRCPFVADRAAVIGWDGCVSPCYALSHNYTYYAIDGVHKEVSRYDLGNVGTTGLQKIWMSEDYCRFRDEVGTFRFPSCPDCDLGETCDLRKSNEGCWGWNPSCADCLYAQDIVRCPGGGR